MANTMQVLSLRISSKLYAILKAAAKAENRSLSNFVRYRLEALLLATKN